MSTRPAVPIAASGPRPGEPESRVRKKSGGVHRNDDQRQGLPYRVGPDQGRPSGEDRSRMTRKFQNRSACQIQPRRQLRACRPPMASKCPARTSIATSQSADRKTPRPPWQQPGWPAQTITRHPARWGGGGGTMASTTSPWQGAQYGQQFPSILRSIPTPFTKFSPASETLAIDSRSMISHVLQPKPSYGLPFSPSRRVPGLMQTKISYENWLPRYTGTELGGFGKYILLTNFRQLRREVRGRRWVLTWARS